MINAFFLRQTALKWSRPVLGRFFNVRASRSAFLTADEISTTALTSLWPKRATKLNGVPRPYVYCFFARAKCRTEILWKSMYNMHCFLSDIVNVYFKNACDAASVHFGPTIWRTNILLYWLDRWKFLDKAHLQSGGRRGNASLASLSSAQFPSITLSSPHVSTGALQHRQQFVSAVWTCTDTEITPIRPYQYPQKSVSTFSSPLVHAVVSWPNINSRQL